MGQSLETIILCEHCQAENPPARVKCWLCHESLNPKHEIVLAELADRPPQTPLTSGFFLVMTAVCLLLIVLIGIGISQKDPAFLAPYVILIGPALLVTGARFFFRSAMNKPTSVAQMAVTFAVSAALTVGITIVVMAIVVISAVIYVINICFPARG